MDVSDEAADLILAGRFRCRHLLKRGAGGDTWAAVDVAEGGRAVVVKTMAVEGLAAEARTRFEHQAQAVRRLVGSSFPSLVASGREGDLLYLARAFVEGVTLRERLAGGRLSVASSLRVGVRLARALQQAHEAQLLRLDVKPGNVVVDEGEPVSRAVLIDFGMARSAGLETSVRDQPVGTARYLAPEAAGVLDVPADERADLYSLGVVLYECLAGRPPFEATEVGAVLRQHLSAAPPALRSLNPGVPRALDDVVGRLLAKDPADRYQSAAAVAADLEAVAAARDAGVAQPVVTAGLHDRRATLTEPAFVGRAAELSTLAHLLAGVADGEGGLVLVEAESGGGKTRLLDELAVQAGPSAWILRGQGVDQTAQRPFQLLDGVTNGIVASAAADPELAGRLQDRLRDWGESVVAALPDLAGTLGQADVGRLGPEAYGEVRSVEALGALLDSLGTRGRPAVVLLDDCQWADGLTGRLLARWHERVGGGPGGGEQAPCHVMVVAAFRSEEVGPEHALRAVRPRHHLVLGPFTAADVGHLCASMAGRLPAEATETVVRLAEGSPFMASAVLRGMVECGALVAGPSGWEVDAERMAAVQTSRRAALFLIRRLELLSPDALAVLSVGAVLGKEFDLGLAAELADRRPAEAAAALQAAHQRHILWIDRSVGRGVFSHDKLREALLARLDDGERRELHRRAARRIEDTDPTRVFELAYHYDAGGEGERALPYALRAAELARGQHALDVAAAHYRIARRAAGSDSLRAAVAEGLGDVLILQGEYPEALECLEVARRLATSAAARAALEGKLGDVAFRRGEPLAARGHLEGALRQLGRRVPRRTPAFLAGLLWEVLVQIAHTLLPHLLLHRRRLEGSEEEFLAVRLYSRLAYVYWFHSGKIPCGWAHLREMNLAERYPPTLALAQAYSEHAPVATMIPWYGRGIEYCKRSLAIRTRLGDLWGQGQSLHFYGVVLYAASRYRECIDQCREAIRLLQRTGDRWEEHTATWHLAFAYYRLGELGPAVELARRVHASATEIHDSAAAGISLSAWSRASGGRVPSELVRAELERHDEDAHTSSEVHLAEAVRLLGEGLVDDAVVVLEAATGIIRRAGLRQEYVAPVWSWLATARRLQAEAVPGYAVSDRRTAISRAARAARAARRVARRYRNNAPHALREQALVAALDDHPRRARRRFDRSLAIAAAQGARYEAALTEAARARVGAAVGWPEGALVVETEAAAAAMLARTEPVEAVVEGATASLSLTDRFDGLLATGRAIAAAPSQEAVYGAVREAAMTLLRGERSQIIELEDDASPRLSTVPDERVGDVSRALVSRAATKGAPVVANEGSSDVSESMVLAGVRSSLCAPIHCEDRVVACLVVTHRGVGSLFGDEEVALAEFVTALAGAALEHVAGSEARYRSLALNSTDVVTIVDADTLVSYQSSSVARVFGFESADLVGRPLASWLHPGDADAVVAALASAAPGLEGSTRVQCRLRHRDGSWRHAEAAVTNLAHDPGVRGIVLNIRDVTERVVLETELRTRASYDSLTGLANRALFTDRMQHALARQSREGEPLAVLFLDLDDFKSLNDTMGHAAGDLLLQGVGRRLQSCVRPGDTVGRFGGDEFAVLLEDADRSDAERVARRVIDQLTRSLPVLGREVRVRASVGVAAALPADTSVEGLLANADAAMYVAKTRGKDRYEVFEPDMRADAVERSSLRTDLAWALDRWELVLHYQPVVAVAGGSIVGFEALLRWLHPERGLLSPAEFIPLAEDSGLIVPIGAWVMRQACEQARAWRDAHGDGPRLTMAVNVSARQLQDPGLVAIVAGALEATGVDPSTLVLEITESATVSETEATIGRLRELKALGVGLAIDDFGTGYSSLSYLRRFPVDLLKIDRAFVAGMVQNTEDRAIVSHVIGLAHAFGLEVVAEGVETVEQLEDLTLLGCDYAQGYNWRRPSSSGDLERWLSAVLGPSGQGRGLRVVVADDRGSVRAAVRLAMEVHGGFTVVAEAGDGREAVEMAGRHQPDLVVLDLVMPGLDGLAALPGIRAAAPGARVVLLTAHDAADVPSAALDQTLGLFDKTADLTTLVDRMAEVATVG